MSLAEQQVRIFIHLMETQPELFSEYRDELIKLIDETPDDAESLSGKIMDWCEEHIDIDRAFANLTGKLTRSVGDVELIEEIPDYPADKKTLKNTIQQSFPD
ncbi:MAG: hypothetical protein AAF915_12335 [Cyanobacteria bacterium P01_D01_bin.50]